MVSSDRPEKLDPNSSVGSRVSFHGVHGTILYVGTVTPHEGLWLGIDWDDQSRGKHDGSYKNVRYFNASSPTSGSFVRPNKVQYGCTFMEAAREKYAPVHSEQFDVIHVSGKKTIEFVGMEEVTSKQSQLHRLRDVILDNFLISRADDDLSLIASSLPNVVELHMCGTLLSDWVEVGRICSQLPRLVYLNLSMNIFKPLDVNRIQQPLNGVRSLILTDCRLDWKQVNSLSALFPNLTELGLCKNWITRIDSIACQCLQSLDLESNPVGCLSNILPLGSLKCLNTLNLSNTSLADFDLPTKLGEAGDGPVLFAALKALYLRDNRLEKWRTINELNKLPCLEHLLIHGNPLLSNESSATARQFVIAKIKNLKALDREAIEPQERRGAEIDYLKFCGRERKLASKGEFLVQHPRFEDLCQVYGAPEDCEMKVTQAGVLKNAIIDLNIEVPGKQPVARKVLGSMTVQKLKALIGRMYSIDVRRMQLVYESPQRVSSVMAAGKVLRVKPIVQV